MYNIFKSFFIAVLLFGIVFEVQASEKTDFLVNDDGGSTSQNDSKVAVAGNHSFVIIWVDRRDGTSDIYLQRYDSDGDPIGSNTKVNDDINNSYQFEPAVAVDLSGLYSVVWKDYRNGNYPFDPDIYFQRFDSSLLASGGNINLTTEYPDSTKESPDIALAPWGGGVVVWSDYRNRNWDIYGQIISSNGSFIGNNFKVNDDSGINQQHAPKVAVSPQGWFVVTWYDNRLGNDDIYIQRFDSLGNKLGVNVKVNADSQGARQAFPDIATDGAGHFTVVWVDWRNGTYPSNPDIYSRKYDTLMTPITDEIMINTDNSQKAQREPCIAADRMGNVAIIWADSTSSSWDIVGQMIDVDGVVRETNFRANSFTDSLQLHPDVALDGQYRYLTWADNRNGNFDIYASIQKYNDPSLAIDPTSLKFEMQYGDSPPLSQSVVINNFGYNSLNYSVYTNVSWLTITPISGQTPDTISITINTDTLTAGTYFGILTFVDNDNHDSTVTMSVRLDVYSPQISLSQDSLMFHAFQGIDEIYSDNVVVENTGNGSFNWVASESSNWINLSSYSGQDNDTVRIDITPVNLSTGTYTQSVVFESHDGAGSSDTLLVTVVVVDNIPYINPQPDSIFIYTDSINNLDTFIVVNNAGVGILNWQAQVSSPWLRLDKSSGLSGDTIRLSVADYSLDFGLYNNQLTIIDSASFNKKTIVPIIMDYFDCSEDTIKIEPTTIDSSQSGNTSIISNLINDIKQIDLVLKYDNRMLRIDSVVKGYNLSQNIDFVAYIDSLNGMLNFKWAINNPDSILVAGNHQLGELFFTSIGQIGTTSIDTLISDTLFSQITLTNDKNVTPIFKVGQITISSTTDINDNNLLYIPSTYTLSQNSPNPFNLSTSIEYELPKLSKVSLEIYNILGQRVITLVSKTQPAGRYRVNWSGRFENQRIAPSGIYFYRLKTDEKSLVKKMILLK